jgi:hypothetical protein
MNELGGVGEGRTDIGSRVLMSQGLRWSDVEGSKTMASCFTPNNRAELQPCESEWEDRWKRNRRREGRMD